MLGWAVTFLVVALVAALLGFGGIAGTAMEAAKLVFFVAIVLFAVSAVIGLMRGRPQSYRHDRAPFGGRASWVKSTVLRKLRQRRLWQGGSSIMVGLSVPRAPRLGAHLRSGRNLSDSTVRFGLALRSRLRLRVVFRLGPIRSRKARIRTQSRDQVDETIRHGLAERTLIHRLQMQADALPGRGAHATGRFPHPPNRPAPRSAGYFV